jgi:hypothetical protein
LVAIVIFGGRNIGKICPKKKGLWAGDFFSFSGASRNFSFHFEEKFALLADRNDDFFAQNRADFAKFVKNN